MSYGGVEYVSADTGKMNGIVHWDKAGNILCVFQLTADEFAKHLQELESYNITAIMYEEYRVDPKYFKSNSTAGSLNEASQCIGMIRYFCIKKQIPMWPVQRHNKNEGYAWSGLQRTTNHAKSHWRDAAAIGYYWLVKEKIITKGTLPTNAY